MPIIYSLVAKGTVVLCEYTHPNHAGNFDQIARKILDKVQTQADSKLTYVLEGHTFNFRISNGHIFMCMADEDFGRNAPFVFLKELIDEFFTMYKSDTPSSYSAFLTVLETKVKQYAAPEQTDTISKIRRGLDEVKDVMKLNIDKVLQRKDQIEVLVDRTSQMEMTADTFRHHSRTLKRNLCWANVKTKLVIIGLILLMMYILAASFCGLTLSSC